MVVVTLSALAPALLGAADADAATVTIRANPDRGLAPANLELVYRAAAGELNRAVVQASPGSPVSVTDPGAVIQPGEYCSAVDAHTASCAPPPAPGAPPEIRVGAIVGVDAQLDDLDDEVQVVEPGPGGQLRLFADGGVGDDVLTAAAQGGELHGGPGDDRLSSLNAIGTTVLDGGGGQDELRGGPWADDTLLDGDRDGAAGSAAPGPDLMDGGDGIGRDTVSYRQRRAPVFVDIGGSERAGASGERDTVRNVESIVGGQGDDHLAGDGRWNEIDGQGGRDTLIGRGDGDFFRNGRGPISCGEGRDYVIAPRAADHLRPDCELIQPEDAGAYRAYPTRVRARSVRYPVRCPSEYDDPSVVACSWSVTIRSAAAPHRRLAGGQSPVGEWRRRPPEVKLTHAGARLASRRRGVVATVTIRIDGDVASRVLRWTIRLKVPAGL